MRNPNAVPIALMWFHTLLTLNFSITDDSFKVCLGSVLITAWRFVLQNEIAIMKPFQPFLAFTNFNHFTVNIADIFGSNNGI